MALSRRTGRSRFTLLLLVLSSVTIVTLDFRGDSGRVIDAVRDGAADALAPVRSATGTILSPVGDALDGLTRYGDLEAENDELQARVAELEGEALRGREAEEELDALLELRGLDSVADIPRVAARVVSAPVSNFEQTIELDRGSEHGVAVDMPVVTGAGLVGSVVEVSGRRAVVRLVTDPASSVGIRLSRSGTPGIAEGEGPDRNLSIGFVDVETPVVRRELVVTSGFDDSRYPPGIPVGRVVRTRAGPGDLQQEIEMAPVADLDHLRFVEVLQRVAP